jgi:hypothetical protein
MAMILMPVWISLVMLYTPLFLHFWFYLRSIGRTPSKRINTFGRILSLFRYNMIRIPQAKRPRQDMVVVVAFIGLMPQLLQGINDSATGRSHPASRVLEKPRHNDTTNLVLVNVNDIGKALAM